MSFFMVPEQPESRETGFSPLVCRLAAGVDVGVQGGIAVLIWLTIHSKLTGAFWWAKLNLAGAVFYGDAVFYMGIGMATLSGGALLLLLYAALGVGFSLLNFRGGYLRQVLLAFLYVVLFHLVADRWLWTALHPSGAAFFPSKGVFPGHLAFVLFLARHGSRLRAITDAIGRPQGIQQPPGDKTLILPENGQEDAAESPPADC